MPVIRKINQPDKAVQEEDVLKDNDEVFYCEMSKEIFRNYEDYFDRIMFLNSTVWTCALTSRPNLTYAEALQSERDARRVLRRFPYELKAPLVFIANCTQRSGISDLVDDVFSYVATRFFREETVSVLEKTAANKEVWRECEVLSVLAPVAAAESDPLADASSVDPAAVRYKVRRIPDEETKKLPEAFVVTGQLVRRPRYVLSKDKLKLFMKQCVECNEVGMLKVKPASYSKCVTDGGVAKFGDIWVGKAPVFEASKWLQSRQKKELTKEKEKGGEKVKTTKKPATKKDTDMPSSKENKKPAGKQKDKKLAASAANQPDISHYFAANNSKEGADKAVKSTPAKKEVKISKEELLRIRKEKEEAEAGAKRNQIEERKRQRAELNQMLLATLKSYNRIAEDLELPDQRPLPVPKPVQTLIPNELLGDALFVVEFLYSFQSVLECTDKFPRGYSLALMERSLLYREVAGPLSDTIQVLLGTVFSLQIEEASEVLVEYVPGDFFETANTADVWDVAVRDATRATDWTQLFLSTPLAELPMDANTVSELLRLHLLTSGAREAEECARWRYQQRGGYRNVDDPGLALRVKHPHILHELNTKTVYELRTTDVLQILMCLVNQIVTYSTVRDKIDERLETAQRARLDLRAHHTGERRREAALQSERKDLRDRMKKKLAAFEGTAVEKKDLQTNLQRDIDDKMRAMDAREERSKTDSNAKLMKYRQEIFSYQMQLGADRAYRTYWLFESLPGLFVECPGRLGGCMAVPVEHNAALARLTNEADRHKYITQMAMVLHGGDKENKVQNTLDGKTTAVVVIAEKEGDDATAAAAAPVVTTELLMCTGVSGSCPVHNQQQHDWVYSFLHTEQELDALITGLNARGLREKALKEQLEGDRELILNHILDCDVQRLQVRDTDREKCVQALGALPNYGNANMGFPPNTSVTDVTEGTLVDNIAELERRVTEGHLATMRVPDMVKWRAALTEARDDGQSDALHWGPDDAFSKDNRTLGKVAEITETEAGSNTSVTETVDYVDPSLRLTATPDDTDNDTDTATAIERVYHIARSLLQVSQAIDPQFLRQPFGASVKLKDAAAIRAAKEVGQRALLKWQVSLMNATSHAQVFLHYTLLEDSIVWSRSTLNAVCRVCRRRGMPEKMLLCDGCNAGRHMFCCKPKLTKVPEGEWFCEQCQPSLPWARKKRAVKRKVFSIESGDEDDMSSVDDNLGPDEGLYKHFGRQNEDDVRECVKCYTYSNVMLTCDVCLDRCHTNCARPPLKKMIAQWTCDTCARMGKKQQRQLKRVKHAERRREQANYAEHLANALNSGGSDDEPPELEDEDDDSPSSSAPPPAAKSRSSNTRGSSGKRKRSAPAPVDSDEYDDDEDEDSQPEVMPTKKVRTSRVANKRKSTNDDDDDDADSDFETLASRRSKSSRRGSQANASSKQRSNGGSRRQSTANERNKRSKKNVSTDDDDDDDEDNQPLVNGGARSSTSASQRRSRRAEINSDDSDMVLDTVACYELLNQLSKHRDAWPFERPVNRTEVPDYHLVIERPMNLARIKSNLNLGEYRTNHELMRDIQQIFENCDVYNTSGSEIYNAGLSLEQFVESRCKELHLPFKPSDMLLTEMRANNGSSKSASSESSRKSTTKIGRKSRS